MPRNRPLFIIIGIALLASTGWAQSGTDNPGHNRQVAITIDDLPVVESGSSIRTMKSTTMTILRALKKYNAPAIGFVNELKLGSGSTKKARTELLKSWLDAGMTLGNHTFAHLDLSTVTVEKYEQDIIRGETTTDKLLKDRGERIRYFRYPFTHTGLTLPVKESVEMFLNERHYTIAPFTIEHDDYIFNNVYNKAMTRNDSGLLARTRSSYLEHLDTCFAYFERISKQYLGYEPIQILLIHANVINAECLDDMLRRMESRGYTFVSLGEALQDKAYRIKDEYAGKFGISWLHRWTISLGIAMDRKGEPDPPQFVLERYGTR